MAISEDDLAELRADMGILNERRWLALEWEMPADNSPSRGARHSTDSLFDPLACSIAHVFHIAADADRYDTSLLPDVRRCLVDG